MDHKLEKFLAIVEYGSFTEAAQRIRVSQPALSVAVNELERELGVKLLHRQRGRFGLTEAGQIVYDATRRIRGEQQAMHQLLHEHLAQKMPLVRVGLLDTVADSLFASRQSADNLLDVEVKVDNSSRLIAEVRLDRLDIAVITAQTSPLPAGVDHEIIGYERFVFVGTPEVIANTKPNAINYWLAFNQASNTYAYFVSEFERHGIVAVPRFYSTSMDLLRSLALMDRGVALLPLHFCADELTHGRLAQLKTPEMGRPLWLLRPANHPQSTIVDDLVRHLKHLLEVSTL
jgi:DNA-binding transcriptional LysR family regulator